MPKAQFIKGAAISKMRKIGVRVLGWLAGLRHRFRVWHDRLRVQWRSWRVDRLLDLLFKPSCPVCRRRSGQPLICEPCQVLLGRQARSHPAARWGEALPAFVWATYGGELRQAIFAVKYHNSPRLGFWLGEQLGKAWLRSPSVQRLQPIVVPLPIHAQKRQERGFDQAVEIARGFCQVTGLPLEEQGLERVRPTQVLYELSAAARRREMDGAFRVGAGVDRLRRAGRSILLIDDILTTGTTAQAGCQALRSRGLRVCGIAAVSAPR